MKYIPSLFPLYPMNGEKLQEFLIEVLGTDAISSSLEKKKDMLIEPSLTIVREKLYTMIMHYVIYGGIYQNKTCEFASRMLAMK
jgi:F0F1-type ATP synthase gamma subunit